MFQCCGTVTLRAELQPRVVVPWRDVPTRREVSIRLCSPRAPEHAVRRLQLKHRGDAEASPYGIYCSSFFIQRRPKVLSWQCTRQVGGVVQREICCLCPAPGKTESPPLAPSRAWGGAGQVMVHIDSMFWHCQTLCDAPKCHTQHGSEINLIAAQHSESPRPVIICWYIRTYKRARSQTNAMGRLLKGVG